MLHQGKNHACLLSSRSANEKLLTSNDIADVHPSTDKCRPLRKLDSFLDEKRKNIAASC